MKISVIIPVYNLEKVIGKCIESVVNQTYKDLDIIIVNDGSIDASLMVIKKYLQKDRRIRLIEKCNEGVEKARLSAIQEARGDWFCFVDGDDWLPKNAIQLLSENAVNFDADIIEGSYYRVMDKYGLIKHRRRLVASPKVVEKGEILGKYYISFFGRNLLFKGGLWSKLYKKSLFDVALRNAPVNLKFGEDLNLNIHIYPLANRVVVIPDIVYCYRFGGITSRFIPSFLDDVFSLYRLKMGAIAKYAVDATQYEYFTKTEFKNCIKSFIEMMITHKQGNKADICEKIKQIANTNEYKEANDIDQKSKFHKDPFIIAMREERYADVYNMAHRKVQQKKYSRLLKVFFSKFLN